MNTAWHQSPTYRLMAGLLLLGIALLLMIDPAFAQYNTYTATSFRCSDGHAVGSLFDNSMNCPTTIKSNNLFSFLICNMERLSSNLLGEMYCGIVTDLIPAVLGMLTLATLFFGMGFTIGIIPATARDFQLFLLKMAFITVFATQSDYLIGTGYNLLVGGLREGVAISLSGMYPPNANGSPVSGLDLYRYLDGFLGQAMHYATDYIGGKWDGTGPSPCKNALFAVMALMAVAFPPVFYIALLIVFRIAITFLRAVFGYIYSIVGIVFLLTMSPFFLSFYLFQKTRPFFDKWLGYLVSFSLQMVILFAFHAFVLSIDVRHISRSMIDIIVPVIQTPESSTQRWPLRYCTLCKFKVVDSKTGADIPATSGTNLIANGKLVCMHNPPQAITINSATAPLEKAAQSELIRFAGTTLLSLLVLAYIIEYVLSYVPALAAFLAGGTAARYAPQLGGGRTFGQTISLNAPGGEIIETGENEFFKTAAQTSTSGPIGSLATTFKKTTEAMVFGRQNQAGDPIDPGMVDTFATFLINPHRDPSKY